MGCHVWIYKRVKEVSEEELTDAKSMRTAAAEKASKKIGIISKYSVEQIQALVKQYAEYFYDDVDLTMTADERLVIADLALTFNLIDYCYYDDVADQEKAVDKVKSALEKYPDWVAAQIVHINNLDDAGIMSEFGISRLKLSSRFFELNGKLYEYVSEKFHPNWRCHKYDLTFTSKEDLLKTVKEMKLYKTVNGVEAGWEPFKEAVDKTYANYEEHIIISFG